MKAFSTILNESAVTRFAITQDEYDKYADAIAKTKRTKEFLSLLWMVSQYPALFEKDTLESVLQGKTVSVDIIPINVQKDIYSLGKKIKDEIRLMPQLLSAGQRDAVINKSIDPNDLMLDLESPKGRDAIAKKYVPLIEKLVRQYADKSALSKEELRSAAMMGLVNAMNEYKNPEELAKLGKTGNMSFTQYAAFRIKQQILDDMNDFGRNVKISNYFQNKIKDSGEDVNREFSIDRVFGSDDDGEPINIDRFLGLSEEDDYMSEKEKEEAYKQLYKRIESKFSSRDCIILYKVWGINGYKREKVKDIARELGISSPAVTQACARILKFVANDKECQEIKKAFESLALDYAAGKLFEVYNTTKEKIIESFVYDDMYLLLENLEKWNNKDKFQKAVNKATDMLCVDDALYIYKILQNKELLDKKSVKKYKGAIVSFLENMYPDQSFKSAKIEDLGAELNDLRTISLKFQIAW